MTKLHALPSCTFPQEAKFTEVPPPFPYIFPFSPISLDAVSPVALVSFPGSNVELATIHQSNPLTLTLR